MDIKGRKYLAAIAACEAWMNAVSPSRAIAEAFDDEGLRATESDSDAGILTARFLNGHSI